MTQDDKKPDQPADEAPKVAELDPEMHRALFDFEMERGMKTTVIRQGRLRPRRPPLVKDQ